MREEQRLFLVQARSAYCVYKLLKRDSSLPHCHALHYLQMATELLGKASAWRSGPPPTSHKSLVGFLRRLSSNPGAQKSLGYDGQNDNWTNTIRKVVPIAEELQRMAPALAGNGPNPEYPWPPQSPANAPAEHQFDVWTQLGETSGGRHLLAVVENVFDAAEEFL